MCYCRRPLSPQYMLLELTLKPSQQLLLCSASFKSPALHCSDRQLHQELACALPLNLRRPSCRPSTALQMTGRRADSIPERPRRILIDDAGSAILVEVGDAWQRST